MVTGGSMWRAWRRASRGPRRWTRRRLGRTAVGLMVEEMRGTLTAFGVRAFDHWQYESELHAGAPSRVEHTLELLEEQGHTYRSEGALWLRSTAYGDDKDRVLVRSSGEHTYFASDIAYHQDKRERGFERQIDIWGADHHGYVARMKAAYEALGGDPGHLEMVIMQLVHLVRRGERAQMSKRAGEFVTLRELVEEIGVDAARWFLLSRSHDTTIDLDLDLAREQSSENPVYYVQYAHARIASMLAKAGAERVRAALAEIAGGREGEASGVVGEASGVVGGEASGREGEATGGGGEASGREGEASGGGGEPLHPSERALVKRLLAFPGEVREAVQRRAPHRIAAYALELAQDFTAFYRDCRVVGAEPSAVESQRIALCVASDEHDCALPGGPAGDERAAGDVGSVEAPHVGLETREVGGAERGGGVLGVWGRGAGAAAPAGEQQEEKEQQREHHEGGHEVGGEAEPVAAGEGEHGGAVFVDERALI